MPVSSIDDSVTYHLTQFQSSPPAPKGLFRRLDGAWHCILQEDVCQLPDWSGAVNITLLSGIIYDVTVTAAVTSLALSMTSPGISTINMVNAGSVAVANPSTGYSRTATGLDDIDASICELNVQNTGTYIIYEANALVAV